MLTHPSRRSAFHLVAFLFLPWIIPVACTGNDGAVSEIGSADSGAEVAVDAAAETDVSVESDATSEADVTAKTDASESDVSAEADAKADVAADTIETDVQSEGSTFDAGPDPCGEVNGFGPVFAGAVSTWSAQDNLGGWPASPVVFVGSSSVRRWEGLALAYTDYSPLQRGMGGAQLGEIAYYAKELVTRHNPRAVVVYAGTNDINAGVAVNVVVDRLRCFRYRVGQALGWARPVLFVGLTPNPARWNEWPAASAVNTAVSKLAESDPGLVYVDVAAPFLKTGSPPNASLYGSDGLHLSKSGYALWNSVIRPAVEAATPPTAHATLSSPVLASGTRILVDLGPSNPQDGELTASPDYLGQTWNNWHAVEGDVDVLPGEQLVELTASNGTPTGVDLVIAGGFRGNGRSNGGLTWPDGTLLGNLAVGSATGDFFFTSGDDVPGALFLRGLDPSRSYKLRLFAARDDSEVRVTKYTVQGQVSATATLQTSGAGAGHAGGTTNDHKVSVFSGVRPDLWGHVFVDLSVEKGSYSYLSILELEVE